MRVLKKEASQGTFGDLVAKWNLSNTPVLKIMDTNTAVGRDDNFVVIAEPYNDEDCIKVLRYRLFSEDDFYG